MKVKIEFDRLQPGVYGNVYEDEKRLEGVQSVLVYVDARSDKLPIYCLNLPEAFADIIEAGVQSLSEKAKKEVEE